MPNIPQPSHLVTPTNIVEAFQNLYNLAFAIFIALAFLSFVYGAFQYLLSGAKIFNKEEGKSRMTNSLIALIVVLIIPSILKLINPQIFQTIKIMVPTVNVQMPKLIYNPDIPGSFPGAETEYDEKKIPKFDPFKTKNKCDIPTQGPCAVNNIFKVARNTNIKINEGLAKRLALICRYESGGNPHLGSIIDKCKDKKSSFSIGLFQINMTVRSFSYTKGGRTYQCRGEEIFNGKNYDCQVRDSNKYKNCADILKDPYFNTYLALNIAKGKRGLGHWSVWTAGVKNCF